VDAIHRMALKFHQTNPTRITVIYIYISFINSYRVFVNVGNFQCEIVLTLDGSITNCAIPYINFKPFIVLKYIFEIWLNGWDLQNNK
jgi:hypothetical protein